MSLSQSIAYQKLLKYFKDFEGVHMKDLFAKDPQRAMRYFLEVGGLKLDYSKNRINDDIIKLLLELCEERALKKQIKDMFEGKKINTTEQRAVLHTALRNTSSKPVFVGDVNIMNDINLILDRMANFALAIRSGSWLGYTNQVITDIVNIGIGGSDLGALMVCKALEKYAHPRLNIHFVSNIDATQLQGILEKIHPETTLFIIASKTFVTQETLTNALAARAWFLEHARDEKFVAKHFVAVSTNKEAVRDFGIDTANMFEFWNWVGGRYSLWCAVGLSIMIYLGKENFLELLEGAHAMDEHFLNTPFEQNMPVILAILGIWYINFFGAGSHIIAPYDQALRFLPKFLQQLDMESNGKQVDKQGRQVDYDTGAIIWGDMGINAQHAFFQLLHQGTHISPIDLIVSLKKTSFLPDHHEILISNVFAQAEAFMRGKTYEEAYEELIALGMEERQAKNLAPHKVFTGNRVSNVILLEELNPKNIGALIALYEHKIFVQGVIWNVNSFDQFGVELGKKLAKTILAEFKGELKDVEHDSSTKHLIQLYHDFNKNKPNLKENK